MAQLFFNNARGVLDAPITAADTTMRVADAEGLPAMLAPGDFFLVTIYKDSRRYGEDHEVVKVVAATSEASPSALVYTVERGYEGSAISHVMGEPVEARVTASSLVTLQNSVENMSITYDGSGNITGTTEVLTDGRTRSSTFGYDSGGNVTTVEVTFEGVTRIETYTYDGAGNVTGMSTAQEFVV
jgi:YD repeat-containing protein